MLALLNLLQVVLYIPLLGLVGQAALYVFAGHRRETNLFYKLLQLLSKPFTWLVRRISPARVADRHVPFATFCLLLLAYLVVTMEKISLCLRVGVELCK
ncbi:hypothetical protein [Aquabacterium sp. J223]|uniref:hypothetical protein n=1 Tax=Aquabacterium sp. J223 TaxID=2898431 RepID=UPI0021ADAB01|nr:hypothetical protein [Aquabacterium sp. J223]UUX94060.1 hypothetical protein LRS07_11950 [Aquabacterium sp. J223]